MEIFGENDMNIFVLDKDPYIAAQMMCDKHIPKMIVESAQMLSTVHRLLDGIPEKRRSKSGKTMQTYYSFGDKRDNLYYAAVHKYHPCTTWTLESLDNYIGKTRRSFRKTTCKYSRCRINRICSSYVTLS